MSTPLRYQLIFKQEDDYVTIVNEAIQEAFASLSWQPSEEELALYVDIIYCKPLNNGSVLVGVEANFFGAEEDDGNSLDSLELAIGLDGISEAFENCEEIEAIIKYQDPVLFRYLQQYYSEIFELEMRLREVITCVFLHRYPDKCHDLLSEVQVPLPYNKKDHAPYLKRFKKFYENEFFHVLFSGYTNTTKKKELKQDDLFVIAEFSGDFNEFRNKIIARGITDEKHIDFLESIKEDMEPIEKVRNCVAHNRSPSDEEVQSYDKARESLKVKISKFLE